jgi:hypothetical protein
MEGANLCSRYFPRELCKAYVEQIGVKENSVISLSTFIFHHKMKPHTSMCFSDLAQE